MAKYSGIAKKDAEREVLSVSLAFTPPTDNMALYRANRRKLEKAIDNPVFQREFIQQYSSFTDFLRKYNVKPNDVDKFLNMDIRLLVKKYPAKK
jgi:hypothetical protein